MSNQVQSQIEDITNLYNAFKTQIHSLEKKIKVNILLNLLKYELSGRGNPEHTFILKLLDDDNKHIDINKSNSLNNNKSKL